MKIHPVISVGQLEAADPPTGRQGPEPGSDHWEVERILDTRDRKYGRGKARRIPRRMEIMAKQPSLLGRSD